MAENAVPGASRESRNDFFMVGALLSLVLTAAVTIVCALVRAFDRGITGGAPGGLLAFLALAQAAAVSGAGWAAATRAGLGCFLAFAGGGHKILLDWQSEVGGIGLRGTGVHFQ